MKRSFVTFTLLIALTVIFSNIAGAQDYSKIENRPFDFLDKFYQINGVVPHQIVNRRTGLDRYSVFPHGLRRRDIWRQQHRKLGKWFFVRDILAEAWRSRHPMVIFHYGVSLLWSLLGLVFFELPRAVHLFIERHSETYARFMERHHPRLQDGMRLLRKLER